MQVWESGCSVTSPSVLGKGKACSSSLCTGDLWVNKACRGQVSAKLTTEICINKAYSNSRLTAAGRQATAAESHSQNCLQTFFFSFLSPYLWWDNWTTPACWKTYWKCIAFELGTFCGVFIVLCGFVLFYFSHLMRQLQNNIWGTISRIGGWGTNTKIIKTKNLLHLNLEILYIYIFFSFIFNFYFYLFIFYFQSSLCLSNAFSAYGWLVHSFSLFISLKLFWFVSLFCFFYLFICISLFL
jgi:hypothetical protein